MSQHEQALDRYVLNAGLIDSHLAPSSAGPLGAASNDLSLPEGSCCEVALMLQAQRQKRYSYFSNRSIFADPSWDILLCLFIAQAQARSASLGELSSIANCAQSTALRWLNVLVEEGLISIVKHSEHLPELGVALSAHGHATMTRYLRDLSAD